MKKSKYVILGGGMVAGYTAKELVERGLKPGELSIVSADNALPYERPPLSKGFLAGKDTEESITINPEKFYAGHAIELKLSSEATAIDTKRRLLRLSTGEELEFENLVLATGARPRKLDVPGSDLPGVLYLRSLDDSKAIRSRAETAKQAVGPEGNRHHHAPARRSSLAAALHARHLQLLRALLFVARRTLHQTRKCG
jgi:NAD(P)H-nitrite reductase large subunit